MEMNQVLLSKRHFTYAHEKRLKNADSRRIRFYKLCVETFHGNKNEKKKQKQSKRQQAAYK